MGKVKNFFKKTGLWFKNHAPTKRRLIQLYTALLTNANIKGFVSGRIYQGATKNMCVPGLNCYSCPGAVGACPLGALQDSLANSNKSAPVYILGILALFGIMFGRMICSFFCPVGLAQELLYKIRSPKLRKSSVTRVCSYFKYVLLVLAIAIPLIYHGIPFFCKYVCPAGTAEGAVALLSNPNNSEYYGMLGYLFSWKFLLLVSFIVLSIFIFRFFCRFICPLGAIYSLFNKIALLGVKVDNDKCIECGACLSRCKMDVKHVGDHECINCGECIPVCPTHAIGWKGSKIILQPSLLFKKESAAAVETAPLNGLLHAEPATNETPVAANAAESVAAEAVLKDVAAPEEVAEVDRKGFIKRKDPDLKKRKKIITIVAWAVALVVLAVALVYYNFLAPEYSDAVYKVGDKCPTFTLEAYKSASDKESYSTLDNVGKVTVINFWYTTCDPCKEELPEFEKVNREYGGEINMYAVHADNGVTREEVQAFLDLESDYKGTNWKDYTITFVQDVSDVNAYKKLGGKGAYPMTIVVDASGIIRTVRSGKMSETQLRTAIESAKNQA